ncbi:MAG: hypothetical protein H6555_01175 [Lewinellaceae bacterium]|nr:hypothetical protein [Lewinellaceae bacterium]
MRNRSLVIARLWANLCFLSLFGLLGAQTSDPLLQAFRWRNIGPANPGGRIVDIEAVANDFTQVFVATGSGGVWKSVNAGTTWEPIFDRYGSASIGDIALCPSNSNIVWVGTGEANNRNSVSWGNGIYKSTDGGKTFQHLGLDQTQQIARIIPHPTDPNNVYVGAIGPLWSTEGSRGLFHTTDGGKTWNKLTNGLPAAGTAGVTDLVMDPTNPKILYAAYYERLRQPWTFTSGGPNGGIYKSTDAGKSWKKLTTGLPAGPTGRIGLAIYAKNPKILMALVEAEQTNDLSKPGSGLYRSEDGGQRWTYVNTYNNRPFYYSQVRINPLNDQRVYLLTTRFMVSDDGGKTLRNGSEDEEVHGDFHAMWLDPNHTNRYYLGADKGVSITHDHGQAFTLLDNLPIAQFYRIGVDMRDPYYVYGGLQDNGFYATASFSRDARGILNDSNWKVHWGDGMYGAVDPTNWRNVFTGSENGSYNRYDPVTHQLNRITPTPRTIVNYEAVIPEAQRKNGDEFRFNWEAPLVMSPQNPHTLFLGSNHLFRSDDQGQTWRIISPDLTTNDPAKVPNGKSGGVTPDNTGAETHCTIFSVAPSPINPAVIWAGTDDGNVQVTRDGGNTWTPVQGAIRGIPAGLWVSRVEASHFDAGTAYVSFDGHRSNNFQPWIYKTTDYGRTWTNMGQSLPAGEVIRVVREDLSNPNLVFIGTETGVWYSLNGGQQWQRMNANLPVVSVYDLVIHPRDGDLIAGTHGRSLWVMDDISPLQQFTPEVNQSEGWLFRQRPATLWENVSRGGQRGHFWFAGENPPSIQNDGSLARAGINNGAMISYYLGEKASGDVRLVITDMKGRYKREMKLDNKPGIHRLRWDLELDPPALTPAQVAIGEEAFQRMMKAYAIPAIRRGYDNFKRAESPRSQLQALQVLRNFGMPELQSDDFAMPGGDPGIYRVTLHVGAKSWTQTLEIRPDPLK